MKVIQEKMNLDQKEMKRFNPVSSYFRYKHLFFLLFQNLATDCMLDVVIIFQKYSG